jgi:hypothetical protein
VIAVYTAIYGGYDPLREQPEIPEVEYVCFTDDPSLDAKPWQVEHRPPRYKYPRLSAKYFKMLPHEVLPHPLTVWIDASVTITDPTFPKTFVASATDGLALFPHPDRRDVYEEADYSLTMPKYKGLPLQEQVAHYGLPRNSGLYACTVMARQDQRWVRKLGRKWLREIERWSYQDQLSLPYLVWTHGWRVNLFPDYLWVNRWFTISPHESEL